jgi:hypothetical protein
MIQKIQKYLLKNPKIGLIKAQKQRHIAVLKVKSENINKKKQDFY